MVAACRPRRCRSDTDVVFATVSHHCPTNVTMPLARRRALLDMAAARGMVVVEDDYEFEMSFDGPPAPSLKSMDEAGAVIHIGSFSKSLFPGLRLGYLVGDAAFIREARALRTLMLRHPPGHLQRTVAYFLSLGHYDAQINRMRRAYAARRDVMKEAIARYGLVIAGATATGGSSFWMAAPPGSMRRILTRRLMIAGVVIEPGRGFFQVHNARIAPQAPSDGQPARTGWQFGEAGAQVGAFSDLAAMKRPAPLSVRHPAGWRTRGLLGPSAWDSKLTTGILCQVANTCARIRRRRPSWSLLWPSWIDCRQGG